MNIVQEKWPEIIEHLRIEHELSNVSFTTWIQPLKVDVYKRQEYYLINSFACVCQVQTIHHQVIKQAYRVLPVLLVLSQKVLRIGLPSSAVPGNHNA